MKNNKSNNITDILIIDNQQWIEADKAMDHLSEYLTDQLIKNDKE